LLVAGALGAGYRGLVTKPNDFDKSGGQIDDEDEEALAAIDEGIRDAQAGRTVPSEKVRKLLHKWISPKL
jgi:hypothetical protein